MHDHIKNLNRYIIYFVGMDRNRHLNTMGANHRIQHIPLHGHGKSTFQDKTSIIITFLLSLANCGSTSLWPQRTPRLAT